LTPSAVRGTTTPSRRERHHAPSLDLAARSRVSPGARCGDEQSEPWQRLQGGRRHLRVSLSPAKARIFLGLTPTPKSRTAHMDPTNGHTTAERLAADVCRVEENVDHRPPRPPTGTGRWDLVRRRLADYRHRHSAQQPTKSGATMHGPATGTADVPSNQHRGRHRACPPPQPNRRPARA
jgi:hypothetical protein